MSSVLFFCVYLSIIIFCTHIHFVGGESIRHAHLFGDKETELPLHSHSKAELFALDLLNYIGCEEDIIFHYEISLYEWTISEITTPVNNLFSDYQYLDLTSRGPPSLFF